MIGLLSRATRARCLCNCTLCVSSTARVAQRTGHSSIRTRLIRPDVFTVFSSTFVFSAAVVDGMRKDRKLQDWDQLIANTQAEIDAVENDQRSRLKKLNIGVIERGQVVSEHPPDRTSWLGQVTWGDLLEWASMKEQERKNDGFQEWKGISFDLLKNLNDQDLTRVLQDKRVLSRFYAGPDCASLESTPASHVYSPKKLRTLEWSLVKLVSKYLQLLNPSAAGAAPGSEAVAEEVKSLVRLKGITSDDVADDLQSYELRLKRLHDETRESGIYEGFPSPSSLRYSWSPSERKHELMDFNQDLQHLLYSFSSIRKNHVKDICSMLLNAKTASDVHTYNLLLVRFCQLRADSFVLATYESFKECHIRPNEITHAIMLRYFAITKNRAAFNLYLQRMNGFRQGLAVADPDRAIDPLASSRYRAFGQTKTKFAELARLNTEVYTCLLKGLVEMSGFDEAAWYFRNMINEGWEPGMELLHVLLQSCCDTADIVSGWRVWKYMLSLCTSEEPISQASRDLMVELCRKCDKLSMSDWIAQGRPEAAYTTPRSSQDAQDIETPTRVPIESYGSAIRRATHDIFTIRELRNRFPYAELLTIEDKLHQLSNTSSVQNSESEEYVQDIERLYKMTSVALRLDSYEKAQVYIEQQKSISISLRRTMMNEVSSAFKLLEELSDLNQAAQCEMVEPRPATDHLSLTFKPSHVNTNVSLGEKPRSNSISPPLTRNDILAEIQKLNADIAPEMVVQAYSNFRETAQTREMGKLGQRRTSAKSETSPLITYMIPKSPRPVDLEAG